MKTFLAATCFCLTALPAVTFAQTSEQTEKKAESPKFVIGLQTGVGHSHNSYYSYNSEGEKSGAGIGLFVRYYMSEHWALESGINYNVSQGMRVQEYVSDAQNNLYIIDQKQVQFNAEIPLQVQYHLLSKESKIRPYFGAGFLAAAYHDVIKMRLNNGTDKYRRVFDNNYWEGQATFTQGITWQINNNWQINQSLRYRFNANTNGLDFKIGIGYTIR